MKSTVIIFTDAVGRGKTTILKAYVNRQQLIGGVLSPKIGGKRFFELIPSGELLAMELELGTLEIGKYRFDTTNFKIVEAAIWNDWKNPAIETVIIDEIGPLELKKEQGFHKLLLKIKNHEFIPKKTLILVVRDVCVQECIKKYDYKDSKIFIQTDWESPNPKRPVGLVLCGGKSERMQYDKGLINYHGIPQWHYVSQLMQPFCDSVYMSLNEAQARDWELPASVKLAIDQEPFKNHGPMTALLSMLETINGRPLFVVACDYPLLEMKHLIQLMKARTEEADVTCFLKESRPEPLISIFETSALSKLKSFFEVGNDSISKFIDQNNANYCVMEDTRFLQNVNSKEEMETVINTLNS